MKANKAKGGAGGKKVGNNEANAKYVKGKPLGKNGKPGSFNEPNSKYVKKK